MKANIKNYNIIIFSFVLLFIAFYCTVSNAQPSESITRINSEWGNGGIITPHLLVTLANLNQILKK